MQGVDLHHKTFLALARGMYMTRLHLLRLTEVVRLGVQPNEEGLMLLEAPLDEEMKRQAFDYLLTVFPEEYHLEIIQLKSRWATPQ